MQSCSPTLTQISLQKFHQESVFFFFFLNFGHVIIFTIPKFVFGRHFEMQHFLNVLFADLFFISGVHRYDASFVPKLLLENT